MFYSNVLFIHTHPPYQTNHKHAHFLDPIYSEPLETLTEIEFVITYNLKSNQSYQRNNEYLWLLLLAIVNK